MVCVSPGGAGADGEGMAMVYGPSMLCVLAGQPAWTLLLVGGGAMVCPPRPGGWLAGSFEGVNRVKP
jgi:hypothetical protein